MNIQQIKQILDNAPEGATHYDNVTSYYKMDSHGREWGIYKGAWCVCVGMNTMRCPPSIKSLSDLRNQLALHEENERLRDALNAAIRACYDVDTHSVREENSDYLKACEILDSIEELSNDN